MRASYRGFRFPVLPALPGAGDAVIFATAQDHIEGLALPPVQGPALAMMVNPNDPTGYLLLVLGRTDEEVRQAAYALSLGVTGLSGEFAQLSSPELVRHRPYDAPRWVRTDRPVRLGELVSAENLQASGLPPPPMTAAFRMAPDLFLWPRTSAPLHLRYRYPTGTWINHEVSRFDISLNGDPLESYRLAGSSPKWLAGFVPSPAQTERIVALPSYQLFGQNELQFYYDLKAYKAEGCRVQQPTNVSGGIDPDSTLDLSGARHFARLPDLAYFASAGFPFTRLADLSETAVVLPAQPSSAELESFLGLMGRFGDATGTPATGIEILRTGDDDALRGRDVLAIGGLGLMEAHQRLFAAAPFGRPERGTHIELPPLVRRALVSLGVQIPEEPPDAVIRALASGQGFGGLTSFRSGLDRKRTVVALLADNPERLPALVQRLARPGENARVQGDVVIDQDGDFASYRVGASYWSGRLPEWLSAAWWINRHPMALVGLLLAAAILIAFPVNLALRAQASRRLRGDPP